MSLFDWVSSNRELDSFYRYLQESNLINKSAEKNFLYFFKKEKKEIKLSIGENKFNKIDFTIKEGNNDDFIVEFKHTQPDYYYSNKNNFIDINPEVRIRMLLNEVTDGVNVKNLIMIARVSNLKIFFDKLVKTDLDVNSQKLKNLLDVFLVSHALSEGTKNEVSYYKNSIVIKDRFDILFDNGYIVISMVRINKEKYRDFVKLKNHLVHSFSLSRIVFNDEEKFFIFLDRHFSDLMSFGLWVITKI